jgi:hypothetical protein
MPLRFASYRVRESARDISVQPHWLAFDDTAAARKRRAMGEYKSQFPLLRPLLGKMIEDFSRYQARKAGLSSRHAELVYRLAPPPHS